MDINKLSSKYFVRRLDKDDINIIYELCSENTQFYEFCPPFVTKDSIEEDMLLLPPNTLITDKYYMGYFDGTELIAILDLVLNYPNEDTVFVGFFMVNKKYQKQGVGESIIKELSDFIKNNNYKYIKLAYAQNNYIAEQFWLKNDFKNTGDSSVVSDYIVNSMIKTL